MTKEELEKLELALLRPAVARLRASVMATVMGALMGIGLLSATIWLIVQGGPNVGAHLGLLSNYYPGYSVTWIGAFVGLFYGSLTGALIGYAATYVYNMVALRKPPPS